MKKYLLLTALVLATTAQADFWSNCTAYGGTIVTANKYGTDEHGNNLDKGGLCNDPTDTTKINNCNGKKFCVGGNKMNWWSAFTWCEAIGGQLASFEHMCPGISKIPNQTTGACPNAKNIGNSDWGWTSTGYGTRQAFIVEPAHGYVQVIDRNEFKYRVPLCEE